MVYICLLSAAFGFWGIFQNLKVQRLEWDLDDLRRRHLEQALYWRNVALGRPHAARVTTSKVVNLAAYKALQNNDPKDIA